MTLTEVRVPATTTGAAPDLDRGTVTRPPEGLAGPTVARQPRRVARATGAGLIPMLGAAASSVALTALLFGRVTAASGSFGFALTAYVLFLVIDTAIFSLTENGPAIRDRLATTALTSAAVVAFGTLAFVVVYTIARGSSALMHLNFFTQDMAEAGPLSGLDVGGIKHALVGTLWMMGIGLGIAIPLGVTGAVFLSQSRGPFAWLVRTTVDAMTALPDIIAGLFIYATWILTFHFEHSGLAAALALAIMMTPVIVRASDVVLRLVSGSLQEAAAALGAPKWRTVWNVVLPTARSGLTTAVILGAARGVGETAPVLLTAGYTASLNTNPLHGPMVSLPLAAFQFVASPQPVMIARGFACAAFLMLLVVVLFVIGRMIGGRTPGQLTGRGARRARRASRRDVARMIKRAAVRARPVRPTPALDVLNSALVAPHRPESPIGSFATPAAAPGASAPSAPDASAPPAPGIAHGEQDSPRFTGEGAL